MTSIIQTQEVLEALLSGNPNLVSTQTVLEALLRADSSIASTQTVLEVIGNANPSVIATQIVVEALVSTINAIVEFPSGGARMGGTAAEEPTFNPVITGGAIAGGDPLIAMGNEEVPQGGATPGGTADYGITFTNTASGGGRANGSGLIRPRYFISSTGGVVINGESPFNSGLVFEGGAVIGGEALMLNTFDETASGGVRCGGSTGATSFDEISTGGVIAGSEAVVSTDHVFETVDCEAELKCGYSRRDQFCAPFLQAQGFGSKLFKANRRDFNAVCLSDTVECYGSTGYLASITLCRQEIRLATLEDQQSVTDDVVDAELQIMALAAEQSSPVELISQRPLRILADVAYSVADFQPVEKEVIGKSRLNTPQMAALRLIEVPVTRRAQEKTPPLEPMRFVTVDVPRVESHKPRMEIVKEKSRLNTPQMAALRLIEVPVTRRVEEVPPPPEPKPELPQPKHERAAVEIVKEGSKINTPQMASLKRLQPAPKQQAVEEPQPVETPTPLPKQKRPARKISHAL